MEVTFSSLGKPLDMLIKNVVGQEQRLGERSVSWHGYIISVVGDAVDGLADVSLYKADDARRYPLVSRTIHVGDEFYEGGVSEMEIAMRGALVADRFVDAIGGNACGSWRDVTFHFEEDPTLITPDGTVLIDRINRLDTFIVSAMPNSIKGRIFAEEDAERLAKNDIDTLIERGKKFDAALAIPRPIGSFGAIPEMPGEISATIRMRALNFDEKIGKIATFADYESSQNEECKFLQKFTFS